MTARPGPGTPGSVVQARDHRRALGAFMAAGAAGDPLAVRSGIVNAPGNPLRVSQTSPVSMGVLVQPGNTEIYRPGRGPYTPYNDATDTLGVDPVPASNSRYDLVYIAQSDSEVDGSSTSTLGILTGTVSPTPSAPYDQVPAGGLALAELGPITPSTTAITDALIQNVAPFAAVRGAPVPVRNQAERDALNGLASAAFPIIVERLDTGTLERNAGSGWLTLAVEKPAQPFVEGGRTTDLGVANTTAGEGTLVTWAVTPESTISYAAGVFTIPQAGRYDIKVTLGWAAATGGDRLLRVKINGTFKMLDNINPTTPTTTATAVAREMTLAAGDQISVHARQNSGAAVSVVPDYTSLSMRRVS